MPTQPENVWPEDLNRGENGRAPFTGELLERARDTAAQVIPEDADVVVEYHIAHGWRTDLTVYTRADPSAHWHEVDFEDSDDDHHQSLETEDLGVVMLRDSHTHLVPVVVAAAGPASRADLDTATRGSVAAVFDRGGDFQIALNIGASWYVGDEEYETGDLFRFFTNVSLIWTAPGEKRQAPKRRDYDIHDEVLYRGARAYISGSHDRHHYSVISDNGKDVGPISYEELDYVSSPERPLSEADAGARGLQGAKYVCSTCGDHGATQPPATPFLADSRYRGCALHLRQIAQTIERFEADLARATTVKFPDGF